MRVVVMGAGAVGSWMGALLARAGHDVTLVGRRDHVAVVNGRGLRVSGETETVQKVRAVEHGRDTQPCDLLLVTVKAYDTAQALEDARAALGPDASVLMLQNGLGNVETAAEAVDDERRVLAGVTTHGVTFVEPGHVRHAGTGYFLVGSPYNDHARARRVLDALKETDLDVAFSDRVAGELWAKVVVNACINPLTAITGLRNGALLQVRELAALMQRAAEEAIDVARAEGAPLPEDDLWARARRVAELTADNKSSMLQDVERGRRTEIDAICGEVVRRGAAVSIDTPVNLSLLALVKGIEESTRVG